MREESTTTKRKPLLSDHKRIGKKLVPPLMQLGTLQLTSWVDVGLPETVWLAVMHDRLGLKRGVEVIVALTTSIDRIANTHVSLMSHLASLSAGQLIAAREALSPDDRASLVEAIQPFAALYPESPVAALMPSGDGLPMAETIQWFKRLVADLMDRTSRSATLAQGTAVYLAIQQGWLHVGKGLSLTRIDAIEDYPDTPESRRVASSVRATLNMYFQRQSEETMLWPRYFWNRGFALESCYFAPEPAVVTE